MEKYITRQIIESIQQYLIGLFAIWQVFLRTLIKNAYYEANLMQLIFFLVNDHTPCRLGVVIDQPVMMFVFFDLWPNCLFR